MQPYLIEEEELGFYFWMGLASFFAIHVHERKTKRTECCI